MSIVEEVGSYFLAAGVLMLLCILYPIIWVTDTIGITDWLDDEKPAIAIVQPVEPTSDPYSIVVVEEKPIVVVEEKIIEAQQDKERANKKALNMAYSIFKKTAATYKDFGNNGSIESELAKVTTLINNINEVEDIVIEGSVDERISNSILLCACSASRMRMSIDRWKEGSKDLAKKEFDTAFMYLGLAEKSYNSYYKEQQ